MIVQTKVAPHASAEEFLKTFETSMNYLKLDHVDLLSLHGINNRRAARLVAEKKAAVWRRRANCNGRAACRFVGFSTHATTDVILEAVNAANSITSTCTGISSTT